MVKLLEQQFVKIGAGFINSEGLILSYKNWAKRILHPN
jgi:hypothetical protein